MILLSLTVLLVVPGAAAWILLGGGGRPPGVKKARTVTDASSPTKRTALPDGITILADGSKTADPRFSAVAGNPAALLAVTEADGQRGVLLFGLGDPGSAGLDKNLALALADRGLTPGPRTPSAVVFSHLHFNIFPPAGAGRPPPPLDLFPKPLRPFEGAAIQGPNLARLCKLDRPSGHLMGSCTRKPQDTPLGIAPLQWSSGPSGRVRLLTYAFSPPMEQEKTSGISLTPQETVLVISAPPGYLVFSFCAHLQAVPAGDRPVKHAAYLVKQAMAAGKLEPGPIHTLITGTCDLRRTLSNQGGGESGRATVAAAIKKMRADLGIRRLFLVHCGLTGDPAAFGATLAYPGAVIPLQPGG